MVADLFLMMMMVVVVVVAAAVVSAMNEDKKLAEYAVVVSLSTTFASRFSCLV